LTAGNGEVVWSAKYNSFGKAEVDPASTVENNLRFSGQYYDQETGLHYNYYRYYNLKIGRYNTLDPIGLAGGINTFVYSLNNPINLIDPLGLKECKDLCWKIFKYPYRKKTGRTESGTWFDQFYGIRCYYKTYKREEKRIYIKDIYECVKMKKNCGQCGRDGKGVYYKTASRATSIIYWGDWKHTETIIRKPHHWNAKWAMCPTDVPNYRGKHPTLLP
jgi:RHS repeat-associated protein